MMDSRAPTANMYLLRTQNINRYTAIVSFDLLVFNGTFSTNWLYRAMGVYEIYYVEPGDKTNTQLKTSISISIYFLKKNRLDTSQQEYKR